MNSQHMLPEKFVNHLYTTRARNIPHLLHNPRHWVPQVRTAWIRYHQHDKIHISTKSDQLIQKFSEGGLDIWTLTTTNLSTEEMSCVDFILLEYSGLYNGLEEALLLLRKRIQQGQPPLLVILADEPLVECSVDLIEKGADAFFTTTTDNEVIFAHCQALLRRSSAVM